MWGEGNCRGASISGRFAETVSSIIKTDYDAKTEGWGGLNHGSKQRIIAQITSTNYTNAMTSVIPLYDI
jgi:hypothetical protein